MEAAHEPAGAKVSQFAAATAEGWDLCAKTMVDHDTKLLGGWREELNNLLIFAGLFSAVVTAFNIESYKWLQHDPQEQSVELLSWISMQLSSFSTNAAFINSTVSPLSAASFHASSVIVSINVLWFLSLAFSLMAALLAILVQQWLRQYLDFPLLARREWACLRQRRYDGLDRWLVSQIISGLSLLLQVALFLFLSGLVTLLWTLNQTVAISVTAAAAVFLIGFTFTAIMPTFVVDCPYKSPLAWAAYVSISRLVYVFLLMTATFLRWGRATRTLPIRIYYNYIIPVYETLPKFKCKSWSECEQKRWTQDPDTDIRAVLWTSQVLVTNAAEPVAASLMYSSNPVVAILRWISYTSATDFESVCNTVSTEAWWGYPINCLQKDSDKRIARALLSHACSYLLRDAPSQEVSGRVLPMLHMMRWLEFWPEDNPEYAPLLWCACEVSSALPAERLEFLSSQLYLFYDTTLTHQQHLAGVNFTLRWHLNVLEAFARAAQSDPPGYAIRNAFELFWLAAYCARSIGELDWTLDQLREQQEPIWASAMAYLSIDHVKPTASYTRFRWFAAFERMLTHTEHYQADEKISYLRGKATDLIDQYIVKSLPDWVNILEYDYLFGVDTISHAFKYPTVRAYILRHHPNITVPEKYQTQIQIN